MVKDWKNIQQQETVQKWSCCRKLSCNLSGNREQSWAGVLVVTPPRLEMSPAITLFFYLLKAAERSLLQTTTARIVISMNT
jgi:hypothetical protein